MPNQPTSKSNANHPLFRNSAQLNGLVFLALSFIGFLLYSNTFSSSFQLDDGYAIVENFRIRHFFDWGAIWQQTPARFIALLSFALNYRLNGLSVFGYHLVNILIHVVSSFFVFSLAQTTLEIPKIRTDFSRETIFLISISSALIFLCHPVQTQAVTYIVQRMASLATMFYLGAVLFYAKGRIQNKIRYEIASLIFIVLAMFTKEIAVTIPFAILLYEFTFLGLSKSNFRTRLPRLAPFLATVLIIPVTYWLTGSSLSSNSIFPTVASPLTRGQYLLTQFNVVRTYLRLAVLPLRQTIDYDYPASFSLFETRTFFSFLFLASIFLSGVYLLRHKPFFAFGIFWFFLTLSVESSIIPISDVIFEHRLYLPMAGLSMVSSAAVFLLIREKRIAVTLLLIAVSALSILTYRRNTVWKTSLTLWKDAVEKAPGKGTAYASLGFAYSEIGDHDHAVQNLLKADELGIHEARLYNALGNNYEDKGEHERAIQFFYKAIHQDPEYAHSYNNLGAAFFHQHNNQEARTLVEKAIQIDPYYLPAYNNLAGIYWDGGDYELALKTLEKAYQLDPSFDGLEKELSVVRARINDLKHGKGGPGSAGAANQQSVTSRTSRKSFGEWSDTSAGSGAEDTGMTKEESDKLKAMVETTRLVDQTQRFKSVQPLKTAAKIQIVYKKAPGT